ncbi:hypothetical protein BCO26_0596 [Heyndrickxia coagulans 2-6]|nr:hypothetical protein BCO26_0596 [Heyndrickxia coagulans 2-6]
MANYPENKRQHAKFTYKIYFRFYSGGKTAKFLSFYMHLLF